MKVLVKCMYHNGELLSANDLERTPRLVGNLVVEHWPSSHDPRGRQARLVADPSQPSHDVLPPLVEPELAALRDNRMVLLGYQIYRDPETGAAHKLQQGWVVHLAIVFIQPDIR
jgi:hypothetical protein